MGCGSSSPSSSLEPIADAASASTPPNQPQPQSSIQSPTQSPPVESAPQEDAAKDALPVKESPDDGNSSAPEPIGSDPAGVGELTSEPPPTDVTDHAHTPAQTEPPTSGEKGQVKEEGESDEKAALPPVEAEKEVSKKKEADEDKNNDATPPSSSSSPPAEVDTAVAPAGVDEVAVSSEIPSVESTQAAEPPQASESVEAPQKEEETVSETKAEAASKPASAEAPSSLTSSSSALEPNVVEAPVAAAPAEKSDTVESSSPVAELPKPDRPAKPQAVFVLGGPGSGKGTQCANIVNQFGWVHLSAGDLLRDERKKNGPHAALIEEYIIQGKIVPADLTVLLLKNAMEENVAKDKTQFLIDGFPRNIENLSGWKKVIGGSVDLLFVLFFDCSEEKMRERLLNRGLTSGRSDDNEEAIVKRFLTYQTESRPVIERYDQNGRVRRVDANKSAEEVWSEVHQIFAPIHRFASSVPASLTTSTPSAAPAIAGSSPMTH